MLPLYLLMDTMKFSIIPRFIGYYAGNGWRRDIPMTITRRWRFESGNDAYWVYGVGGDYEVSMSCSPDFRGDSTLGLCCAVAVMGSGDETALDSAGVSGRLSKGEGVLEAEAESAFEAPRRVSSDPLLLRDRRLLPKDLRDGRFVRLEPPSWISGARRLV